MEGNSRVIFSSRARLDSLLSCDLYGVFSECLSIQHGHGLLALAGGNFNSFWPCAVFSSYLVYNSLDCCFFWELFLFNFIEFHPCTCKLVFSQSVNGTTMQISGALFLHSFQLFIYPSCKFQLPWLYWTLVPIFSTPENTALFSFHLPMPWYENCL